MASMDCTQNRRPRLRRCALISAAIAALALGWAAVQARADGDPASDVLATQTLFLPQDAGLSLRQQSELAGLLASAAHSGYRIRVAVVASPTDLGSVTELWHQPQTYSHFLAQELSSVYRGTLLVVMPNGYGVYGVDGVTVPSSAARSLGMPGASLGDAALTAIRRLAAASGHSLPRPTAISIATSGSSDIVPWVVFALGLVLIAAAWTISLRARPWRLGGQPPTSS